MVMTDSLECIVAMIDDNRTPAIIVGDCGLLLFLILVFCLSNHITSQIVLLSSSHYILGDVAYVQMFIISSPVSVAVGLL